MRIFENCVEAINEIKRDLYEMGTKVHTYSMQDKIIKDDESYATKEIQAYGFIILDSSDKEKILDKKNLKWCKAEFKERISDKYINPGKAWKIRKNVWEEFIHENKFAYTYNSRIRVQLPIIIQELKKNPNTRQAIIQIYNNHNDIQNLGGVNRIPCSISYQFMIRNDKLDIIYFMRSSDFFTHFKNDMYQAISIRNYVAKQINKPIGKFIMFVSSLHGYKKDFPEEGVF